MDRHKKQKPSTINPPRANLGVSSPPVRNPYPYVKAAGYRNRNYPGSGSSSSSRSYPGWLRSVGAGLFDVGFQGLSSFVGGAISDYFNRKAESRADARTRQMMLDQPYLTAEGRRRAGLNPYGDASFPGMVGQSTTDTSSSPVGQSFDAIMADQRYNLDERVALQQLANQTAIADADVNLKNAQAESVEDANRREAEKHPLSLRMLENQTYESDVERNFVFANAYNDMLKRAAEASNEQINTYKLGAEIYHLCMDADYLVAKQQEVYANISKMQFDQQFALLDLVSKFVLQENEFYHDTEMAVMARRFEAWKQQQNFAHERFMLGKSQEFNASENQKHRTRQMWDNIISTGVGALATIAGAILMGTGAGAAPGALLASIGLTKMANSVANFGKPTTRIGFKQ